MIQQEPITHVIDPNWQDVRTAKDLSEVLWDGICRLRRLGYSKLADEWSRRRNNMPQEMEKEAINYVLFAATKEAENAMGETQ